MIVGYILYNTDLIYLLRNIKTRKRMNSNSIKKFDGKGTDRTVKKIIECLKN